MTIFQTNVTVTEERVIVLSVPPEVSVGEHTVVVVIEPNGGANHMRLPLDFPVDHYGEWPADLSLSREELYGDDGR